jgi:hypothetical protein
MGVYGKTPRKTVAEMPTKRGILSVDFACVLKVDFPHSRWHSALANWEG